MNDATAALPQTLPSGAVDKRAVGWWGLLCAIAGEAALFAYLLFAYYYDAIALGKEFLLGPMPTFKLSLPDTIILVVSSGSVWAAERSMRQGRNRAALPWLLVTIVLGVVFVVIQGYEWKSKTFSPSTGAYGSIYFTLTGFHLAHVVAGLVMLVLASVWCGRRYFDRERHAPLAIVAAYWHFVDLVWLCVFFTIYVTPRLWA